jgi:hypothetical protein
MTHGPLTITDAVALQTVLEAARNTRRVRWVDQRGNVLEGTARRICRDESGALLPDDADVRDGTLHITTAIGLETFVPVAEVIAMVGREEFALDD